MEMDCVHEHGAADVMQELESVRVSEHGIPKPQHVRQVELLGEQQRDPAEAVELRVNSLGHLRQIEWQTEWQIEGALASPPKCGACVRACVRACVEPKVCGD